MVEAICPDLFRIEVPLPKSPLKYLNAYVVRGSKRSLLIDTGLNEPACRAAIEDGLREVGVDRAALDIFITHFHADHFSLVPQLATDSTRIYFNRAEAEIIENWQGLDVIFDYSVRHGFPRELLRAAEASHPGAKFGSDWVPGADIVQDGQQLAYGDYRWTCLATPGHSRGHVCLYEADKQILISGDHILIDITPNIQCWADDINPLADYLESLRKTYPLKVNLVLPGHRRRFADHRRRIDELLAHHEQRLAEVLRILETGPRSAYRTAAAMQWDIKADTWEDFPVAQQWFATGEALAHLRYLEQAGKIVARDHGGTMRFGLQP